MIQIYYEVDSPEHEHRSVQTRPIVLQEQLLRLLEHDLRLHRPVSMHTDAAFGRVVQYGQQFSSVI